MSRKTWKIQGIFCNVYPSQGNVRENKLLVSLSFPLATGMVVGNVVALIVVSRFELYHLLLCEIASICVLPID